MDGIATAMPYKDYSGIPKLAIAPSGMHSLYSFIIVYILACVVKDMRVIHRLDIYFLPALAICSLP